MMEKQITHINERRPGCCEGRLAKKRRKIKEAEKEYEERCHKGKGEKERSKKKRLLKNEDNVKGD